MINKAIFIKTKSLIKRTKTINQTKKDLHKANRVQILNININAN